MSETPQPDMLPRDAAAQSPRRRWGMDLLLIWAILAAMIGIRATAPSNTYAYAQIWHTGIAVDVATNGNWLVQYDQTGKIARKPPMWYWLTGGVLKATGRYEEFTFRTITVASAFLAAAMIYALGCRWFNRRAGLLAGLMWPAMLLQFRMCYLAATDMLLTVWIIGAVMCVDRVLWHRTANGRRWTWLVGFYACMIFAGLTKGLGLINWCVMGVMVAIISACWAEPADATAVRPFRQDLLNKAGLILQRWWRAMVCCRVWWGVLAFVIVVGLLFYVMLDRGGVAFLQMLSFEYGQRTTGSGDSPPQASAIPVVLHLIYYTLPVSVFAIGALALEKPRLWFSRHGATLLPLAWIIAVTLPFSIAYAFRPDYVVPCFPAMALLGGWGADRLIRVAGAPTSKESLVRHIYAATTLMVGLACAGLALVFVLVGRSAGIAEMLDLAWPASASSVKVALLWAMVPAGLAVFALGIYLSLKWRIGPLVALACVGMLGVDFVDGNFLSRHARTGDGDKIIVFAHDVRDAIGEDEFVLVRAGKLGVEPFLGRFGLSLDYDGDGVKLLAALNASDEPMIITCDRGLVSIGAATPDKNADYRVKVAGQKRRFRTHPEQLGEVVVVGDAVASQMWGRMYLIRRVPGKLIVVTGEPIQTDFLSGAMDE